MNWHTNDGAGPRGPWTEAQVVQLIHSGQLRGGHVAQDGAAQWVPLAAVPVFEQALRAAHAPRRKGGAGLKIALAIGALIILLGGAAGGYHVYIQDKRRSEESTNRSKWEAEAEASAKARKSLTATVAEGNIKAFAGHLVVPLTVKGGAALISIPQALVTRDGDKAPFRLTLARDWKNSLDDQGRIDVRFDDEVKPGKYTCEMSVTAEGRETAKVKFRFEIREELRLDKDKLTCTGRVCEVALRKGMVEFTAPKGTAVTFAGRKHTVQGKSLQLPIESGFSLANVDPTSPAAVEVPVTLAFPDGVTLKGKFPISSDFVKSIIGDKLAAVVKGGVAFAGDDAAPPKARLVAEIAPSGYVLKFHGSGRNLKSVDLVIINESKTQKSSCGNYRDSKTGAVQTVDKELFNFELTVYERRTGRVKVKKLFNAPPEPCPTELLVARQVSSFVPDAEVQAFIKTQMTLP